MADARKNLAGIVREAEDGEAVEITRRGEAVAVVISPTTLRRLAQARPSFAEAYAAWRAEVGRASPGLTRAEIARLRDRSHGRRVRF